MRPTHENIFIGWKLALADPMKIAAANRPPRIIPCSRCGADVVFAPQTGAMIDSMPGATIGCKECKDFLLDPEAMTAVFLLPVRDPRPDPSIN